MAAQPLSGIRCLILELLYEKKSNPGRTHADLDPGWDHLTVSSGRPGQTGAGVERPSVPEERAGVPDEVGSSGLQDRCPWFSAPPRKSSVWLFVSEWMRLVTPFT